MVSTRQLHFIEIMEFLLFAAMHVMYSAWTKDEFITQQVFIYAVGMSIMAAACLIVIKNEFLKQLGFAFCIMLGIHLIGTVMGSLAFGICIYMVAGTVFSIYGDRKLNLYYLIIVNCTIAFELIMEYDIIVSRVPIEYYVMMILTCEIYLLTESYMVMLYQQKVEEIQIQNELLGIAQKSKDEFLANMSHEIRTPMNAIVGMSELILREDDIDPKVTQYCHNIESAGQNLLAIINDILDFSKIESGNMTINYEPYSIATVVQEVVNTAMFRRGYKDIAMIVDMSPNIPRRLNGDEIRMRQIITNIITNAVKFTEQGFIFIQVSCHDQDGENWLKISVRDSGIGIKKEDLAHLFESFRRIDSKKNRSIEGTGLGLPICKQLVELMNGTIRIQSEYGRGTIVSIDIPQRVMDRNPSLSLKQKDISVLTFLLGDGESYAGTAKYYHIAADNMWDALSVHNERFNNFDEFKIAVEQGKATHIMLGTEAYRRNRDYFNKLAGHIKVFVYCDPRYSFDLGENIYGINIPFCAVTVISAINGEVYYNELTDDDALETTFITPNANILVVDDNDLNRKVAEGILNLYHANCILASGGKKAMAILEDQNIDIVFMDHMMPELDGVETTKMIRQKGRERYRNVPIIAMTANVVNDAKQMFLKNGFQDFIPKPISVKDVGAVLKHWLPRALIEYDTSGPDITSSGGKENEVHIADNIHEYVAIDEDTALENMGGQRDLYKELLEYCLEFEEKRWGEIQEMYDKQDWKEYTILVHALKGGMRSLGIEELALAAQGQEFACKENRIDDAIAGHAPLKELYDWTHRSIEHYLETYEI